MVYYPLSKIQPNLYTNGSEFALQSTGRDYKGYYFKTYDEKYFTGKTPSENSEQLLAYAKLEDSTIAAIGYGNSAPTSNTLSYYVPIPTEEDYSRGYMMRYVIKRVNGDESTIKEVSQQDYDKLKKDPLYISTFFIWKLTGSLEDSFSAGGYKIQGIMGANTSTIKGLERLIGGIARYFYNPSQFYRQK